MIDDIKKIVGENNVLENEDMSKHCTFRTGGTADLFVEPKNSDELVGTIKFFKNNKVPYYIIGNGSNLLVGDKGIRGAVIHIGDYFSQICADGTYVDIGAGALLSHAAQFAAEKGLKGFEFASGIPGSFGGAVFMNAGAYGGEIKDIFESAQAINELGEIITLKNCDMKFGYRKSVISEKCYIVLSGRIKLEYGDKHEIKNLISDLNCRRREKQPLNFASAGSTFKRPEGHFAGKLIEDSGLKGYKFGGAMVSEKHAGFVVNTGTATTCDILAVIEHCKKTVREKFSVELETEIRFLGEQ